jgi:hypothetical protein
LGHLVDLGEPLGDLGHALGLLLARRRDTDVLISAAIRPSGTPGLLISALIERDAFELVLSPSIIAETEETLKLLYLEDLPP